MSYELNFDRQPNYIHAIVTGQNTAETVVQYMTDIQSECKKQDCYRVLIEENLEGPRLSEMEIFNLVSKGSSAALGFFEVLAYVDENQQFAMSKFAETVAVNRGLPSSRVLFCCRCKELVETPTRRCGRSEIFH